MRVIASCSGGLPLPEERKNRHRNKRLVTLKDRFWTVWECDLTFTSLTFMSVFTDFDSLSLSHLFYGCSRVSLSVSPYYRLVSSRCNLQGQSTRWYIASQRGTFVKPCRTALFHDKYHFPVYGDISCTAGIIHLRAGHC